MGKRGLPDIHICPSPRATGLRARPYASGKSRLPCYK